MSLTALEFFQRLIVGWGSCLSSKTLGGSVFVSYYSRQSGHCRNVHGYLHITANGTFCMPFEPYHYSYSSLCVWEWETELFVVWCIGMREERRREGRGWFRGFVLISSWIWAPRAVQYLSHATSILKKKKNLLINWRCIWNICYAWGQGTKGVLKAEKHKTRQKRALLLGSLW